MPPTPVHITDLNDPRIDAFRNVRERDLLARDHLFMAESELVLRRLLRTPHLLHSVFLSPVRFEKLAGELAAVPDHVPVYVAEIDIMSQIVGFHVHRGVLATGLRPKSKDLTLDAALGHLGQREELTLLAAEGLTNVDNMGGLFRNAAAFAADGVVLDPTCCDPLYRKSIRVSMGHALAIPYAVCVDWPGGLVQLKEQWGVTIIGAETTDGAKPLWEIPTARRIALLFGSEGPGLSGSALAACDAVCSVPMAEDVPSINVAVASALFLYELRRRRGGG